MFFALKSPTMDSSLMPVALLMRMLSLAVTAKQFKPCSLECMKKLEIDILGKRCRCRISRSKYNKSQEMRDGCHISRYGRQP